MAGFTPKVRSGIIRGLSVMETEQQAGIRYSAAEEREIKAVEDWLRSIPRGAVLVALTRDDIDILQDAACLAAETWGYDKANREVHRKQLRRIHRACKRLIAQKG